MRNPPAGYLDAASAQPLNPAAREALAAAVDAGWADPVVDSRPLDVRFSSLASLLADLRAQALSNVLAQSGPALSRDQYSVANHTFGTGTVERFEILTLSGWKR